jgi:hydroxypyruvate isomerase
MAPHELVMILEPLNTLVNHAGYFLNLTSDAFDIVREVGSPYLKIRELGYKDLVAMEYTPAKDPMTTLAEVRAMAG